jgi:hypothetical protein
LTTAADDSDKACHENGGLDEKATRAKIAQVRQEGKEKHYAKNTIGKFE